MARPSKDPQIRINEILDATEPLFYAKGYYETAISDIAEKMGVAHGMIYYYFKSKEEILEALISRQLSAFISRIKSRAKAEYLSPPQKLSITIQTLVQGLYREDGLMLEFLYNERTIHFVDKVSREGKQLITPLMLKIIEEGDEQQYFHVANSKAAVNIVHALIESLIEAIYEKVPESLLADQYKMAQDAIESILGAQRGTLQIYSEHKS